VAENILHHYDPAPFREKVRLALGPKRLEWKPVKVGAVPPRPLLDLLTGGCGYRRLPGLQIGADIECDTQIIFQALEPAEGAMP
jgi:glutathione S-transferase